MRKKKNQPELPVVDPPENPTGFKFKVINLRKSAYPTNSPEKSDVFGFKVGDLISKNNGTIYEILSITRRELPEHESKSYEGALNRYGRGSSNHQVSQLLEEYKKNGNFGVCQIEAITRLRGSKHITKGRRLYFSELQYAPGISYTRYSLVDLPNWINNRQGSINYAKVKIKREQDKLATQVLIKEALEKLLASRTPKEPEIATVANIAIVDEVPTILMDRLGG